MDLNSTITELQNIIEASQAVDPLLLQKIVNATSSIISFVLGILVYGILVGVPLITACDIAYITIPTFRNKLIETNLGKPGRFKIISDDAYYAMEESDLSEGKHPLRLYFRKRVKTYILIAVLITIVVGGGWPIILDWIKYFVVFMLDFILKLKAVLLG